MRCEHGYEIRPVWSLDQCRPCWRKLSPTLPIAPAARSLPCVHEEEIQSHCPKGDESLHLRGCAVHDQCTRQKCQSCGDYDPGRPAIDFHVDNRGIGDSVCGLYAACGLADAGYAVTYRAHHRDWLAGASHPGVTILDHAPTAVDAGGDYQQHLRDAASGRCWSHAQWYCDRIAERCGLRKFSPSRPTVAKRPPVTEAGYTVLAPFASNGNRSWPAERWRQLAGELVREGRRVVGIDGPGGGEKLGEIFGGLPVTWHWGMPADWVLGLIGHADSLVGNDSGMAHVAGLLGTPTRAVMAQLPGDFVFGDAPSVVPVGAEGYPCQGCAWQGDSGWRPECDGGCAALLSIGTDRVVRSLLPAAQGPFDITPYLFHRDGWPATERPGDVRRCYEFKFEIARRLNPKRILEIGVRYGYSAAAFLAGSPNGAELVGIDADNSTYGGDHGAFLYAERMLKAKFPGSRVEILRADTQVERPGVAPGFDLAHVDGDHSYAGCLSDLRLAVALGAKWILVDDITHPRDPGVAEAVREFIAEEKAEHEYFLGTLRGDCLIRVNRESVQPL